MTSLTPSALTFEDVLRALQGPWSGPGNTLGQLAARTGRDKSNLRRDLFKLVEQGLAQGNPNDGWTLGEGGMPALNAIDRANAEGVQVAGLPLWPLDQIELNPDNPRKSIVQAPLEGLADTIAFAEGLPFIEREASKAEALFIGLVENSQREGLTAFEDAKGLKAFADETGLSARAIAFKLGRAREGSEEGVRDVQEKIAVLRKAKPEALIEVEEGRQSFDWLKRQIRKTVEEVAGQLRPIDLMVLAEVKHRCRVHPRGRYNTGETECSYLAAKDPVLKSLTAQGLLRLTEQSYEDHKAYIGPGHSGYSVFAAEELDGLSREEADAQQVLHALRTAAVGEDKANAARNTKRFVTDWLNGPFALSPKAAAKVAEAKATKVEIREKSKAQKAAVDKRMAEVAELGALAQASIDAPLPSSPSGLAVEAIAQAFNAVNIALPVKVAGRSIIDANDNTIVPNLAWRFYEKEPVALELLVIALNAAFGFPTARPDTSATADEEPAHAAA